jgi:hypothetical protein
LFRTAYVPYFSTFLENLLHFFHIFCQHCWHIVKQLEKSCKLLVILVFKFFRQKKRKRCGILVESNSFNPYLFKKKQHRAENLNFIYAIWSSNVKVVWWTIGFWN